MSERVIECAILVALDLKYFQRPAELAEMVNTLMGTDLAIGAVVVWADALAEEGRIGRIEFETCPVTVWYCGLELDAEERK